MPCTSSPPSKFSSKYFISTPFSPLQMLTWDQTTCRWFKDLRWDLRSTGSAYKQHCHQEQSSDPSDFFPGSAEPVTGFRVLATREVAQLWLTQQVTGSDHRPCGLFPGAGWQLGACWVTLLLRALVWTQVLKLLIINQKPQVQIDSIWNEVDI